MCTAWCTWQRLNRTRMDPMAARRMMAKARLHLDFVTELYKDQVDDGRFFLHEHPAHAESWEEPMIKVIETMDSVEVVQADQCQYDNVVTFGLEKGMPIKKPTKFMSNAPELLKKLMRRCEG